MYFPKCIVAIYSQVRRKLMEAVPGSPIFLFIYLFLMFYVYLSDHFLLGVTSYEVFSVGQVKLEVGGRAEHAIRTPVSSFGA